MLSGELVELPATSVAVRSAVYAPLSANVCVGFGPKATPPSENVHFSVGGPQLSVLPLPSKLIGVPSAPEYGDAPTDAVGGRLSAPSVPSVVVASGPVKVTGGNGALATVVDQMLSTLCGMPTNVKDTSSEKPS